MDKCTTLRIKLSKSLKNLIKLNRKKNHLERDIAEIQRDIEKYKLALANI